MTKQEAAKIIIDRRTVEIQKAESAFLDAINNNLELKEIETAIRIINLKEAKGERTNKKESAMLHNKKAAILNSYSEVAVTVNPPLPHCSKCSDTAFIGNDYCSCVQQLILSDKKNIEIPCQNFSTIDYSRFDKNHAERNKNAYLDIQKICNKFPENKRRIVLISGGTGTGKTLLAGCAANTLLKRGFSVTAITAFGFVNRALKFHTTFDENKLSFLEPLTEADLLVIDDLGTESILKNVTHEYLYTVLNERINKSLLTIITTNLSKDGIENRYGERISSRLFDKNIGYQTILGGKDLRNE